MPISRRDFVKRVAAIGVACELLSNFASADDTPTTASASATQPTAAPTAGADLRWLDGQSPAALSGVTWGISWPRSAFPVTQTFALHDDAGGAIAIQSWPLAYWPDGSLKWTAHAAGPEVGAAQSLRLTPASPADLAAAIKLRETADGIEINTGIIRCTVAKSGQHLIHSIDRDGHPIVANAHLICLLQDAPDLRASENLRQRTLLSAIDTVTVEQSGPVRAVIRLQGKHEIKETAWGADVRRLLPFSVRLYFYAGSDAVRIMHTFVFDGDEKKDFIRGLGVRFEVPLRDQPHDRHVRFAAEGAGLWAEAVRNLTGLRRPPGSAVVQAQLAGKPCPPTSEFPDAVASRLNLVPAWDGYSLFQSSADAFTIRKRTASDEVCWITAAHGSRASGLGYIGGPTGGCAFGLRDFWQRHPTELEVSGAAGESAHVTLWLYSPQAPAMDLRGYHDDMGMTTHAQELEGLEITYEDYEHGFASPVGIARSSELFLWALPATPTRQRLTELAEAVRNPPVLVARPEHYHACEIFGSLWSLPDRSTPAKARIENQLDWYFDYYRNQVEQRRWYGFWDYGDVMHTYDADRHCWRYDVGGFAWDNSELSPDLWLWYSFLRTGDAKTFRFAEAMTRHTGEVDVYHLGRFAMLGSRHNVLHWGDSAKQLRISTAAYRRFYYFLTADERAGDLMHELVHADKTFAALDPQRKIRKDVYHPEPHALAVGFGTDWGSLAAAWLAEWERTGDVGIRDKLLNSMKSIAAMPHGFFSVNGAFDPDTGLFTNRNGNAVEISHLSALFGLPEMCAELIQLLDVPAFEKAWLDYCQFYNADSKTRAAALGFNAKSDGQVSAHSRLSAYAANKKQDSSLAGRAWEEFFADDHRWARGRYTFKTQHVDGPAVLTPIDEAAWVSTNDTAQWCLAAIQNLALIPRAIPSMAAQ